MKDKFIYVNVFSYEKYSNALSWAKHDTASGCLPEGYILKFQMCITQKGAGFIYQPIKNIK